MKTIKEINELVQEKGGAGAFNRGYGNALEDVLELMKQIEKEQKVLWWEELKSKIEGKK